MTKDANLVRFRSNMTVRMSCRQGDYVLWVRPDDLFKPSFTLADVWEMQDGDYVTITNRECDLPTWFTLQPDETAGQLVYEMMQRLEQGFRPGEKVEGPNIWRVCAGDRIAWVGPKRPPDDLADVQRLFSFSNNALAAVESSRPNFSPLDFMGISKGQDSPEAQRLCQVGYKAACDLGTPRTVATEWSLG